MPYRLAAAAGGVILEREACRESLVSLSGAAGAILRVTTESYRERQSHVPERTRTTRAVDGGDLGGHTADYCGRGRTRGRKARGGHRAERAGTRQCQGQP